MFLLNQWSFSMSSYQIEDLAHKAWGVDESELKYRITECHVKGIVTIISILPLMLKYIMKLIEYLNVNIMIEEGSIDIVG